MYKSETVHFVGVVKKVYADIKNTWNGKLHNN